jgi:hypothetical protein
VPVTTVDFRLANVNSARQSSLVASDGGVFSFGDATFFGSTGGKRLSPHRVGSAAGALVPS